MGPIGAGVGGGAAIGGAANIAPGPAVGVGGAVGGAVGVGQPGQGLAAAGGQANQTRYEILWCY